MSNIIRWFIKTCKSIKENYLKKSPKQKWLFIRDIGISILSLSGVPILDPNHKTYWYSYAVCGLTVDYTFSFFYTIWYYFDQPMKSLQSLPLLGVLIPVIFQYFCNEKNDFVFSFLTGFDCLFINSATIEITKISMFTFFRWTKNL